MGKDKKAVVRSHAQERDWLLSLGNGNIIAGVRSLIGQTKEEQSGGKGSVKGKEEKAKK